LNGSQENRGLNFRNSHFHTDQPVKQLTRWTGLAAGTTSGAPADLRKVKLLVRERIAIWLGLGAITAIAWAWLIRMQMGTASGMSAMQMAMPMPHRWSAVDLGLNFLMWSVMMVAMMVPSASPMVMTYACLARPRIRSLQVCIWVFTLGYLCVWTGFSAGATLMQSALQHTAIVGDQLRATPIVGALLLAAAGVFQFTPLKDRCLAHCRSPIGFFMTEWREGPRGAFVMGLRHGGYCVGCCWMLMALLFVAGVMNLLWVAAIGAFVLIEKVSRFGRHVARAAGVVMLAAALLVASRG
jgi:predicted metal-binding membrane protein